MATTGNLSCIFSSSVVWGGGWLPYPLEFPTPDILRNFSWKQSIDMRIWAFCKIDLDPKFVETPNIGCGVAQIVVLWLAVKQARVFNLGLAPQGGSRYGEGPQRMLWMKDCMNIPYRMYFLYSTVTEKNNLCVYLGSGSTGGPTAKPAASVLAQKQNVSCLSKDEAREVGRDLSKVIHLCRVTVRDPSFFLSKKYGILLLQKVFCNTVYLLIIVRCLVSNPEASRRSTSPGTHSHT